MEKNIDNLRANLFLICGLLFFMLTIFHLVSVFRHERREGFSFGDIVNRISGGLGTIGGSVTGFGNDILSGIASTLNSAQELSNNLANAVTNVVNYIANSATFMQKLIDFVNAVGNLFKVAAPIPGQLRNLTGPMNDIVGQVASMTGQISSGASNLQSATVSIASIPGAVASKFQNFKLNLPAPAVFNP